MQIASLVIIFNLFSVSLFSQIQNGNEKSCKPFTLTVKVNNLDTGKILIMYANCNDTSIRYTANLKNGIGKFTGFINKASEALIVVDLNKKKYSLDGPNVIRFILEPKSMSLTYSINSLGAFNIETFGSKSQTALEFWEKNNYSDLTMIKDIRKKMREAIDNKEKEYYILKSDSVYQSILQKVKSYVSNNTESYLSPYLLKHYKTKIPIDTLKAYFAKLSESAKYNSIGEALLEDILTLSPKDDVFLLKYGSANLQKQLKAANNFLDFSLLDANNKLFYLNNFKGQYTFVNVWASWCQPCIKNIPAFEKLKNFYKNQPINFVSISVDKKTNDWKKCIELNKLSGINLIDTDGILTSFYEIQSFPTYMIIAPDGSVEVFNVPKPGSSELNKIIDKFLLNN